MKEYYISSTKCSIQERQTKNNGKLYDVVFRIVTLDGTEKQKKLSGFKTKTLAKQAHADFITEKCELVKNNPVKKKDKTKQEPTLGDLVPQYIAAMHNQTKESTIYDRKLQIESYILPDLKNVKMTELTKERLYEWQDKLWATKNPRTQEYFSYAYLTKIRGTFAAFLSWAEQRYDYPNNFSKIKKPKRRTPKTEMQFWTEDQFKQFINVVDDPTFKTIFVMLFYTGRRKGEILSLTPDDIKGIQITFNKSLTRKTLDDSTYKVTSTKTDKIQTLPISRQVQQALKEYEYNSPFLFGGDTPIHENTLTYQFKKYCAKAELDPIRIHDLRHSFVSLLIHKGANLMVVADLIGDTVEQVMKTYGHMYQDDKIEIINSL